MGGWVDARLPRLTPRDHMPSHVQAVYSCRERGRAQGDAGATSKKYDALCSTGGQHVALHSPAPPRPQEGHPQQRANDLLSYAPRSAKSIEWHLASIIGLCLAIWSLRAQFEFVQHHCYS